MNVYLAEFTGTAILILLGDGVVANCVLKKSKAENGGWIVITLGWGLAVAMAVYAVGRISGAHINPAVTLSLASIGAFSWGLVPGYVLAQIAGAGFGGILVYFTFLAHWKETEDPGLKLAVFSTAPAIRDTPANVITEAIGTAMLVFGVLAIGSIGKDIPTTETVTDPLVREGMASIQTGLVTGFSTWFGPMLVGLLVLSIGLSLGGPTGYAINPARDLGPRIAHALLPIPGKGSSDWGYSWVPVVAPIAGGIAGAWLFILLGL
ncbi:MAG: MIP/aquaporin family protein [Opitutales bacterium]